MAIETLELLYSALNTPIEHFEEEAINLENLKDASIQHYVFQEEEYVEEMCYYGSEEEATEIIARIIDVSTGDSWQELGTPSVEIDGTIVYPYSYVDESGDNDGLEAVVPKCK